MDTLLIEYLNSGEAWLLVGSGPSIDAGYPSWADLANEAHRIVALEVGKTEADRVSDAIEALNYPQAFERSVKAVGISRLLAGLRPLMGQRDTNGELYGLLSRWPIRVYMTTNFDDAIHRGLVNQGEA